MQALAYGGACVGEVLEPASERGVKIFVPNTVPGEEIRARICARHRSYFEGELLSVFVPSSDRREPPCAVFGVCGGCDLQHIEIGAQRESKREMVESMLFRQAGLTPRSGVQLVGAPLPEFGYRRRIELHVAPHGAVGFYRAGSGEVVEFNSCLIAAPFLNEQLRALRPVLAAAAELVGRVVLEHQANELHVALKLRDSTEGIAGTDLLTRLREIIGLLPNLRVYRRGKLVWQQFQSEEGREGPPAGHFSQVNEQGNRVLVQLVLQLLRGDQVTELYAGAGNFSLPLAERGASVLAVEADSALTAYGATLAAQRGVSARVQFRTATVERFLRTHQLSGPVLLDPPRSGARAAVAAMTPDAVPEVVYVSCNLPTLARDLRVLNEAGFALESVTVVDMFPHTHHVETVSRLIPR